MCAFASLNGLNKPAIFPLTLWKKVKIYHPINFLFHSLSKNHSNLLVFEYSSWYSFPWKMSNMRYGIMWHSSFHLKLFSYRFQNGFTLCKVFLTIPRQPALSWFPKFLSEFLLKTCVELLLCVIPEIVNNFVLFYLNECCLQRSL